MSLTFPSPSQPSVSYVYRGFLLQVPVPLPHGSIGVEYQVSTATDDSIYTPYWTVAIVDATTNFAYIFSDAIASIFYQFRYRYRNFDGTTSDWSDYVAAGNGTQTSNWSVDQTAASIGTITSGFIRGVIFETNANYPKVRMDPSGFYAVDGVSTPVIIPSDPSTPITFQGKIVASSLSVVPTTSLTGQVTTGQIGSGAIATPTQLNIGNLSLISPDMGTITAGTITSATFQSTPTGGGAVRFDSTGFFVTNAGGTKDTQMTAGGGIFLTQTLPPTDISTRKVRWLTADSSVATEMFSRGGGSYEQFVLNQYGKSNPSIIDFKAFDAAGTNISYLSLQQDNTVDTKRLVQVWAQSPTSQNSRTLIDGTGASHFVQTFDGSTGTISLATPIPTIFSPITGFSNSYINYNNSFRYWKDSMSYVHIVGEFNTSGGSSTAANTLMWDGFPAGYTPKVRFYCLVATNAGTGFNQILINTSGQIRISDNLAGSSSYMNFGHTTFPTF